MVEHALDAGIAAEFVTADEAYEWMPPALRHRGVGYVLAAARNHRLILTGASRLMWS
jgi:hypothetical protein